MIFFGLGPHSAIFLVFLGAFYPILLNTIFGVRSVDAAAVRGRHHARLHRHRAILPVVSAGVAAGDLHGLRLAHGFAWILIVVGEMTGVPTGPRLGHHGRPHALAHRPRDHAA